MAYSQHGRDFEHRERRHFDRIYGAQSPNSTHGAAPSLRAIGIMLATVIGIVLLITLLSWSSSDSTTTGSIEQPAVTQPAPAEQPATPSQ